MKRMILIILLLHSIEKKKWFGTAARDMLVILKEELPEQILKSLTL